MSDAPRLCDMAADYEEARRTLLLQAKALGQQLRNRKGLPADQRAGLRWQRDKLYEAAREAAEIARRCRGEEHETWYIRTARRDRYGMV